MADGQEDGDDHRVVHRVSAAANLPVVARRADHRIGLEQILEPQDLVMDPDSPRLSSSSYENAQIGSPGSGGSRTCCFPRFGGAVPGFSEVSLKVAETASHFGWQIAGSPDDPILHEPGLERQLSVGPSESDLEMVRIIDPESMAQSSSSAQEQQVAMVAVPSGRDAGGANLQSDALTVLPNLGGAVSLFNATSAAMMGVGQSLISGPPAVWQGLVSRVQTTLRGSADDIGWLKRDHSLPPVVDKTERFVQLLGRISHGVHVLPDSIVYLLIPGLFSNHGPLYFVDTKKYFSKLGLVCHIARIHSEAAVETNALELKECIEELFWGTGKRVLLLGHSKGGVDAAAACATYWHDLKDKVVGLVFAQSPYGGSPVASDILREGQIADFETRRILEVVVTKVIKGDMQSLEDLTYDKRRKFVADHPLPPELLTVSFHTEASRAFSVLSTMSHIAHTELPWLPTTATKGTTGEVPVGAKLPVAMPLAAAMALCALHLDLRYGEKSDGLVARMDAEVPGSVVVRPEKKLDHAWMVYSPSRKEANDPDAAQMCEALLTLLLEEEAARTAGCSGGDDTVPALISDGLNPTSDMPSTEIQKGEDYLGKL